MWVTDWECGSLVTNYPRAPPSTAGGQLAIGPRITKSPFETYELPRDHWNIHDQLRLKLAKILLVL